MSSKVGPVAFAHTSKDLCDNRLSLFKQREQRESANTKSIQTQESLIERTRKILEDQEKQLQQMRDQHQQQMESFDASIEELELKISSLTGPPAPSAPTLAASDVSSPLTSNIS
eukprot:7470671-Karenia_brevis.AAC.1